MGHFWNQVSGLFGKEKPAPKTEAETEGDDEMAETDTSGTPVSKPAPKGPPPASGPDYTSYVNSFFTKIEGVDFSSLDDPATNAFANAAMKQVPGRCARLFTGDGANVSGRKR